MINHIKKHSHWVKSIDFSNDEKFIVSGSEDRAIKVWSMDEGLIKNLNPGHAHWVNTLNLNTYHCMRYCFINSENLKTEVPSKDILKNKFKV